MFPMLQGLMKDRLAILSEFGVGFPISLVYKYGEVKSYLIFRIFLPIIKKKKEK